MTGGRRGAVWLLTVGIGAAALGLVALPVAGQALRLGQSAPEIAGGPWINGGPLTTAGLRGRVVLVEFWTYG
jgi:hypothetical protein